MENDLIRRSDLLAKKCMVRGHLDTGSPCPSKVTAIPVDVIERAQAVDAVEVVRCRDCKFFRVMKYSGSTYCKRTVETYGIRITNPGDFCSYGERKGCDEDG